MQARATVPGFCGAQGQTRGFEPRKHLIEWATPSAKYCLLIRGLGFSLSLFSSDIWGVDLGIIATPSYLV